ncbi:CPBP family intramembrane glutamic endopeptidase [Sphingosinithalassobacter portus]|uniref:CPBP family intramembrane glutamic endopeptidase n=1 Tax=Stakelama portus TaxID=2676234 RepID=UPI000D6E2410|nr:CPBP family intramembrane glutamic endopeptidase [Sphingosinithalassobacter portus]
MIPVALLAIALLALAWAVIADFDEFRRFQLMEYTHRRQRMILWWTLKYFLLFVGMGAAGLAILGRLDNLWVFPADFTAAIPMFDIESDSIGFIGGAVIGALLGGGILGGALAARRPEATGLASGVESMMPRNGGETRCTALLSINAGVSEEIFFRLYLPLLFMAVGTGAILAFVLAGLLFALAHAYQGFVGIVVTGIVGAVLTIVYLISGSLWLVIAIHVALDLNALVLRPTITRFIRQRAAARQ